MRRIIKEQITSNMNQAYSSLNSSRYALAMEQGDAKLTEKLTAVMECLEALQKEFSKVRTKG